MQFFLTLWKIKVTLNGLIWYAIMHLFKNTAVLSVYHDLLVLLKSLCHQGLEDLIYDVYYD